MRNPVSLTTPFLLVLIGACAAPRATGPGSTTGDEPAIRALSQHWLAAEEAHDVDAILALYTEDAVEYPSNTPPVHGKDAIRAWYRGWLFDPSSQLTFATESVTVSPSGDMAYELGTYRFVTRGTDGTSEDRGKYVTVWVKRAGRWLVAADINNSDLPLPASRTL